jgi:hypothetical protein
VNRSPGGTFQDSWTVRHPRRGSQCHKAGVRSGDLPKTSPRLASTNLKSPLHHIF